MAFQRFAFLSVVCFDMHREVCLLSELVMFAENILTLANGGGRVVCVCVCVCACVCVCVCVCACVCACKSSE